MNVVCKVRVLPRIGPSGVRALPLAAGINVGGHYWSEGSACAALGCWHKRKWPLFLIFLFSSSFLVFLLLPLLLKPNKGLS